MDGFTKLFGSILNSTIWMEDDKTRLVWITMLAMKNGKHQILSSVPGLAHQARVSVEDCMAAVKKLEGPDPHSTHQEHEGRRIEKIEGGWILLNGQKYADKLNREALKEYKRNWQQAYRDKLKTEPPPGSNGPASIREALAIKAEG